MNHLGRIAQRAMKRKQFEDGAISSTTFADFLGSHPFPAFQPASALMSEEQVRKELLRPKIHPAVKKVLESKKRTSVIMPRLRMRMPWW